ncbi:MAG: nucleotide exchange factor GrpE [Pyrinomonadaceae bacterium]
MEEFSEEIDMDDLASIDDFIKELEAREKDLDISSETVIEIEEPDFELEDIPESMTVETVMEGLLTNEAVVPEPTPAEKAKLGDLEKEVSELRSQISKMESERVDLVETSRRRQNDFENFKKRTERDREETFNNQISLLIGQILPVLDNLNRALNSASDFSQEKSKDFQQFYDGIVLVGRQLNEVLKEMGVEPIEAVGETFDPHFHEAVATEETSDFPINTVIEELLRGYCLGERVIRPAMVKVATSSNSAMSANPSPETN